MEITHKQLKDIRDWVRNAQAEIDSFINSEHEWTDFDRVKDASSILSKVLDDPLKDGELSFHDAVEEQINDKSLISWEFSRSELNGMLREHLFRKFEVDDQQWEKFASTIHNDCAWEALEDALRDTIDNLVYDIQHELSCQNRK